MLSTLHESVTQTTCVFILRSTYTTDVSSYPPRKKKRSRMLSVLRESVAQMGGPGSGRLKLNASIEIDMLPPPPWRAAVGTQGATRDFDFAEPAGLGTGELPHLCISVVWLPSSVLRLY